MLQLFFFSYPTVNKCSLFFNQALNILYLTENGREQCGLSRCPGDFSLRSSRKRSQSSLQSYCSEQDQLKRNPYSRTGSLHRGGRASQVIITAQPSMFGINSSFVTLGAQMRINRVVKTNTGLFNLVYPVIAVRRSVCSQQQCATHSVPRVETHSFDHKFIRGFGNWIEHQRMGRTSPAQTETLVALLAV
jgi:hypothetical protein